MLVIKRENLEKSKIKLTVKVPAELMRGYFAKVYNKLASQVEVKGFRKGMAPKHLTISVIGESRLMQEILDLSLQDTFGMALKQEKILPVAPPKVNIKMMKDLLADTAELEYEVELEVLPEIKLGNYKKIKIKKSKTEIKATEDEVKQVLSHLQRQHAEFKEVERSAEDGDRVEMDFAGTEKGVKLENLSNKNYPVILGSKVLIPDFEKEIIGMKKGEEKEFNVKLGPQKKDIHFQVKILDIKEVILPPVNDELAKKFQKNSIDELKKAVQIDILKQKELAEKQKQENELIEELLKTTQMEVPAGLVEQEIHREIDELRSRTSLMGMPFENYLAQIKKTEEDLHKDLASQAEKTVKIGLILGEIGKQEKIDLKDKEAGRKVIEKLLEEAQK